MKEAVRCLKVSYHRGVPYAAYYYLAPRGKALSVRTELVEPGMVIDFDANDRPLGIEITAPPLTTLEALNAILVRLGFEPAMPEELAPLRAA